MNKLQINPNRIELDEAYMQMAEIWAKRSKANRLQVGALIVKDGRIISDGYNGMPAGATGDDDVCEEYGEIDPVDPTSPPPVRTKHEVLHAEANAILKLAASTTGGGSAGATLYCTYSPCPDCAKLIVQAKIARVVYRNHYRLPEGVERLQKRGIQCDQLLSSEDLQLAEKRAEQAACVHEWRDNSDFHDGHYTYICEKCDKTKTEY